MSSQKRKAQEPVDHCSLRYPEAVACHQGGLSNAGNLRRYADATRSTPRNARSHLISYGNISTGIYHRFILDLDLKLPHFRAAGIKRK